MNIKEENDTKEIILSSDQIAFHQKEQDQLYPLKKEVTAVNQKTKNSAQLLTVTTNPVQNSKQQLTEIQNLKEELKAKEQLLANYINAINTSNASIEFDLEGNILSANKNFLEIMGYSEMDLVGKHHSLFVDSSYSKSNAYQLFWNNLKKGIYQKDEFIRVAKNGKLVWLSGSYNPILDTQGKPYKILKIATDITVAKTQFLQLAVQAQEKEKRASELVIANKELKFQNEQKEKRASELIIANKELKFQNEQKEKRAAELIIANKKLAAENILKQKRKVEKEKRAAELLVTNRELAYQEKRTKELTLANDELKKAQEELESFSYSVSHDLRAPIRAINGYTQILTEDHIDTIDDDGKNVLLAIIRNSNKMGVLIDDLLAFSKLGRKQVSASNINMTALVNAVISEIPIEKDENTPIFELDELAASHGDSALIKQVWINLISNAIKYSKNKSETKIKITSVTKNDKIIYSIQDWGAGFDMAYYDKLFGVFQRLHSQEEFSGTGIGLAIVQKIVNRHHGTVWAESKLDAGAKFYFSLPDTKH